MAPKDYSERDLESLFKKGSWKNWSSMIKWLEEKGEQDEEFSPEEVRAMKEDLVVIREAAVPFTPNAHEAYRLVHHPHPG